MSTDHTDPDRPQQRWVSIVGAAVRTGLSVSTIRRFLRAGRLTPHRPIGAKVLIDVGQLDGLILASAG
jgi:excisionase family DNA binding protein